MINKKKTKRNIESGIHRTFLGIYTSKVNVRHILFDLLIEKYFFINRFLFFLCLKFERKAKCKMAVEP